MAIQKTDCIVLKNQDFRETSILGTFFTKDFGKIQGIIKGVRGSKGKINNSLEPFAYSGLVFYERKRGNLHTISQCDLKNYFHNIRKYLKRTAYAYYFSELIKDFLQPHDKNPEIFNLLLNSFTVLDEDKIDIEVLARIFELKLISLSGFKPKVDYCLKCREFVEKDVFFNFAEGGLMCGKCALRMKEAVAVSPRTLFFMHLLESRKISELIRLKITPFIKKELNMILHQFMQVHVEKDFKSLKFIRQIEGIGS